jgi:nucleoside-diphosphate-sugar epimerase
MKVVVAGGSGALGRRLCDDLAARGHDVVVLTRTPRPGPHRQVRWDGVTVGPWTATRSLMSIVRQVLHRPAAPPTPEPLPRLGALLLRTDPALALTGRRAV